MEVSEAKIAVGRGKNRAFFCCFFPNRAERFSGACGGPDARLLLLLLHVSAPLTFIGVFLFCCSCVSLLRWGVFAGFVCIGRQINSWRDVLIEFVRLSALVGV